MTEQSSLRKLITDSLLNFSRQSVSVFLGFITSILLARLLGVEGRGLYALVILIPTVLLQVLNSGIQSSVVYYVARKEEPFAQLVQKVMGLSFWISVIATALGLLLILLTYERFFQNVPLVWMLFGVFLAPVTLFINNSVAIFRGIEDFRTSNMIELIPQMVMLVVILIAVGVLDGGVLGAVSALFMGRLGAALFGMWQIWRLLRPKQAALITLRLPRDFLRKVMRYGVVSQISLVATLLNYRADVFILNALTDSTAVGLYDMAVQQVESLWMLSKSIGSVIFARSASLEGQDEERTRLTSLVTRHVLIFSILSSAVTYIVAEWGIVFFYGEDFRGSAYAIRALLPGIVALSASRVMSNDLAGRGKPGINAIHSILGATLNVILNLILIPEMGYIGTAIATTCSYTFVWVINIFTYAYITKSPWHRTIIPTKEDRVLWRQALQRLRIWWRGRKQKNKQT